MAMAMTTSLQLLPSPFKNGHFRQPSRRPFTVVAPLAMAPPSSSFPFQLSDGQVRDFHQLPSGLGMEVIRQQRKMVGIEKPALVFVHGSYHAAWCWAVHWLPFFSMQGHDSFAISLVGQGESGVPKDRKPNTLEPQPRKSGDVGALFLIRGPYAMLLQLANDDAGAGAEAMFANLGYFSIGSIQSLFRTNFTPADTPNFGSKLRCKRRCMCTPACMFDIVYRLAC